MAKSTAKKAMGRPKSPENADGRWIIGISTRYRPTIEGMANEGRRDLRRQIELLLDKGLESCGESPPGKP